MQADQRKKYMRVSEPAKRLREQLEGPRRRALRPANDNGLPITRMLERGALILVPLMVFLLLAYAVMSPR